MPEWKQEIRWRLAKLKLVPTREAAIVEELARWWRVSSRRDARRR